MDKYHSFSKLLLERRHAIALTGAGISVESGIPDFRGCNGLWTRYDPFEYGHIDSFRANPSKVWKMLLEMDALLERVSPNEAHIALGELERLGIIKMVITQNVDSLHQRGGSFNVVEFHGNFRGMHCNSCEKRFAREDISLEKLPPLCSCGGPIRPDVILFGEGIPPDAYSQAFEAAERCDLILVVGTSASVAPASQLPLIAKKNGARVLEINPVASELSGWVTDLHIMEPAAAALGNILRIVRPMHAEDTN
ncbi:NAD-dependent protein deacylase 1 [Syntrophobacter sp. SbD1]|nr:NAD-dependent protein deacylase 1 [Syntrophobacter sp. SbD1]